MRERTRDQLPFKQVPYLVMNSCPQSQSPQIFSKMHTQITKHILLDIL